MSKRRTPGIKELLAGEKGRIGKEYGDISVLLVYPSSYYLGMSNLGFQTIYRLINEIPYAGCERGFLIEDGGILVMDGRSRPTDFDVLAFSISFELDYPGVARSLLSAGIPVSSADRDGKWPLVMAGGAVSMINPEPIADLMDLVILGEAETSVAPLLKGIRATRSRERDRQLEELAGLAGVYVPRHFRPIHDGEGNLKAVKSLKGNHVPETLHLHDLNANPSHTVIFTPNTEFRDMHLIEVSRGCVRSCRFCAARYAYRPFRYVGAEEVIRLAGNAMKVTNRIGLVGTAISDHPQIDEICGRLSRMGARISVSSFRADSASTDLIRTLAEGGTRTITIAPETGTEELRRSIGKDMPDDAVFRVAEMAKDAGIRFVKLYFMIGLPGETDEDIEAISRLSREVSRILPVKAGISPFVPKPRTRFERRRMNSRKELQAKSKVLRKALGGVKAVEVLPIGIREAMLEAFYSRSGREASAALAGGKPSGDEIERLVCAEIGEGQELPWDFLRRGGRGPTS